MNTCLIAGCFTGLPGFLSPGFSGANMKHALENQPSRNGEAVRFASATSATVATARATQSRKPDVGWKLAPSPTSDQDVCGVCMIRIAPHQLYFSQSLSSMVDCSSTDGRAHQKTQRHDSSGLLVVTRRPARRIVVSAVPTRAPRAQGTSWRELIHNQASRVETCS